MKVPIGWLSEYCDPGWEPEHLAERLAMTGTEVERVSRAGAPSADGFVVGLVKAVERHPDADRLSVCRVDTGDGERTIVCGAPNVAAGQLVPVALPGAVLPGGTELKRTELRGVTSDGMILSEAELEIGEDSAGIAVLGENEMKPGTPLSEVLGVAERVLELEVTSNRSDCQAIYGVAREVHAISEAPLADPPWSEDVEPTGDGKVTDLASVTVEVPELCPRFTARVFIDVEIGPSPAWLKARLTAAGQRPINNVVDVTNYVMLLIGQPLHAFDLDRVPGGELIIRTARKGETMTTLDGVERSFDPDAVLVCHREAPSGIAGIMGGADSEVSESTTRVLLEVATWNGPNILRTSRKLGLRSEASARFEKQLHPALAIRAQRIASALIVELCGAKLVPGTIDVGGEPDPAVVSLRVPKVEQLIGLAIDADTCAARLERLGFGVGWKSGGRRGAGGFRALIRGANRVSEEEILASVPPERAEDVSREADLIEEVARLADLDRNLPSTLPSTPERVGGLTREQLLRRAAEDAMRAAGCDEIVGWSLTDPGLAERLRLPDDDPRARLVSLSNPLSSEQSVLRPTLLGSLLDAARLNLARGVERVALFESGHVYLREEDAGGSRYPGEHPAPVAEPHRIGYVAAGAPEESWRAERQPPDYFSAKGVLELLCGRLGAELSIEAAEQPFLQPGRSAAVLLRAQAAPGVEDEEAALVEAGWIGELHPLVARAWDLEGGAAFELDLAPLVVAARSGRERYGDVITYPPVHQDLAVVVPDQVPAAQVREAILTAGGELIRSAEVFDLYRGEQAGEGRKSLALRLSFQAPDRTLTEDEVNANREQIRDALTEIGGSLRE